MSDPGMPGTPPEQEGEDGQYGPASFTVLEGLEPSRRPWQVLLTWTGADPPGAPLCDALGRILDLFPDTGRLTVRTADGGIVATRDFHGNAGQRVDDLLAGLFRANPAVTGVAFPATPTRAAHTATPDDPFWSCLGKAGAGITAAMAAGRITPEQAIEQFKRLYTADAGTGDPTSPGA